jgi:hypothetical protein
LHFTTSENRSAHQRSALAPLYLDSGVASQLINQHEPQVMPRPFKLRTRISEPHNKKHFQLPTADRLANRATARLEWALVPWLHRRTSALSKRFGQES